MDGRVGFSCKKSLWGNLLVDIGGPTVHTYILTYIRTDGGTEGRRDGVTDGVTNGRTDGRMDRRMDGRTDAMGFHLGPKLKRTKRKRHT
jgi:hypothetical protein